MRLRTILAAAAFCVSTLAAHADTMQLFNLNLSFDNGGTMTGTVNLDLSSTSSHNPTLSSAANLTYTNGATTLHYTGMNFTFGTVSSGPSIADLEFLSSSFTDPFLLLVPTSSQGSLAGFNGGVCTEDASTGNCGGILSAITVGGPESFATTGSLAPPVVASAATPEPASVALLATGLLGLAGRLRSRRRASQLHG